MVLCPLASGTRAWWHLSCPGLSVTTLIQVPRYLGAEIAMPWRGEGHLSARDCMVGFPTPSWGALALGLCVLAGGIQQLVWTLTRQDGAPRYLGGPPSPRSAPVPQRE